MKSNLISLVRVEFQRFLSSFSSRGKKANKAPSFYFVIIIFALLFGVSFVYSWLVLTPFVNQGIDPAPSVSLFAGAASMAVFVSSMNQARGIYIGDDYELLTSLPIRKRHIVASKILALYGMEFFFAAIFMLPHTVMLAAYAHNATLSLIALLLAFSLPIVPIAVATLVSLLVAMATARFKSANIIFAIIYALLIAGLSVGAMIFSRLSDAQARDGFASMGNVFKWFNPSYLLVENALVGSKLYLLAYVGINLGVAIFTILFLSLFFDRLHEVVSSISMGKNYAQKNLKVRGENKTLLSLEFKRLINSKLYFINAIMGSVMGVAGSVVFMVTFNQAIASASGEGVAAMKQGFIPIFLAICFLIFGIGNPATGCINIEGKNFWLIKSLPTNYKKYLRAKLLFSWILTIPSALIASTIAVIFRHENVYEIIAAFVLPLLYVILSGMIGLIVAIHHPKLKWNSETEAVKNSASVLISMLIGFGLTIVLSPIMIGLSIGLPQWGYLGYLITFAILLAILVPCGVYLSRNFAKIIAKIEDF